MYAVAWCKCLHPVPAYEFRRGFFTLVLFIVFQHFLIASFGVDTSECVHHISWYTCRSHTTIAPCAHHSGKCSNRHINLYKLSLSPDSGQADMPEMSIAELLKKVYPADLLGSEETFSDTLQVSV